jgi:uncharacterized protein (DUF1786 family)
MLLSPSANSTVKFKLDIDGADSSPICRVQIPIKENVMLTITGSISEGSVSFEIPALKQFVEKGKKVLEKCLLEATVDDQYFRLNEFTIDLKEEFSIKAEVEEEVSEAKTKPKMNISIDTSEVEVDSTYQTLKSSF